MHLSIVFIMSKNFVILALFAIWQLTSMAAPIDANRALKKAQEFFQAKEKKKGNALPMKKGHALDALSSGVLGKSATDTSANAPYYIFNHPDGGFVVVAGDDHAHDILAYSDHGSIDADHIQPAMKAILDGYAEEMKGAAENCADKARKAAASANQEAEARLVIAPMLSTQWGLEYIFGEQCFTPKGKQAAAGAAAAAMAQVMYYYRYPKVMEQPVEAYTTANGDSYGALEPTVFEWDLMLDSYQGFATEPQIAAVAHICAYAAHAAKTNFGTTYSSANIADVAAALNGCFGYANPCKLLKREECGVDEWDRIIYHELAHGRPVIYAATNGLDSAHTFVCDGYDGEGFYHINWGREGLYDGYYRLQAINLATQVSGGTTTSWGYSMSHQAIVGIAPNVVDDSYGQLSDPAPTATWQDLEVTAMQQMPSNNLKKTLRVTVENHGTADFAGPLRLLVNDSYVSFENLYLQAGGKGDVDFLFSRNADTYAVKVVDGRSMQVLFEEEAFTITDAAADVVIADYEVLSTDVATMTQYGSHFDVDLTLQNNGEADYYGKVDVKLYLIQSDGEAFVFTIVAKRSQDVVVEAGTSSKITMVADDLRVGDHFYYAITAAGTTIRGGSSKNNYTVVDGYAYWDREGSRRMAPMASEVIIPDKAVAVDFAGKDLAEVKVVPNANPNTLYYIDADTDVPSTLFESNVVMGAEAVGDITFSDGYDCFVPRHFHVGGEVAYSRSCTKGGFADGGWQTIVLPFAVEKIMAKEQTLDWQHGFDGHDYNCWLRSLTRVSADTAYFEAVDRWRPNVPYLFAVPDARWGEALDLTNVPLRFSATNTLVERTAAAATMANTALFQGTMGNVDTEEAWVIDDEGAAFARTDDATALPFGCWMRERNAGSLPYEVLHIASHSVMPGDVNNDGIVSVVDVMTLVDFISGNSTLSLPLVAGDVAKDSQLSVADVMAIVSKVME